MTPILEARGLSRSFGHVRALDNADFDINAGEVVALIGDNGAGKSTLVKALSGNLDLDEGEILFEGKPIEMTSPQQVSELGIEVVYQDLALAPHLDPAQNVFLGREIPAKGFLGKLGFMDNKEMRRQATGVLRRARRHRAVADRTASGRCPAGNGRASPSPGPSPGRPRCVFLDEPTAALGVVQTKNVLETIKRVRDKGIAVVLISHSMPHVLEVADRVQVLRLGRGSPPSSTKETSVEQLVGAMTGALDFRREVRHDDHLSQRTPMSALDRRGRRHLRSRAAARTCSRSGSSACWWSSSAFFAIAGGSEVLLRATTSR